MPKIALIILIATLVIVTGLLIYAKTGSQFFGQSPDPSPTQTPITTFEQCVAAGNPVMESYPPQCAANGQTFTKDLSNQPNFTDQIILQQPTPNQEVSFPLSIKGQARGTWFFEAAFPVKLTTTSGEIIAESFAQTQGEWMTEDFVTFTATLEATPSGELSQSILVLEKANPSGLPENAEELKIPLRW